MRRVNRYSLHSGIVSMREGNTFLRLDGFFSFFSRPPFFRPGLIFSPDFFSEISKQNFHNI